MKYRVLHDLSLRSSTHFQIDTLLITASYAVVFEVKNIAGELKVVNNPPQLICKLDNGEVKGFNSPITQLQSNCEFLHIERQSATRILQSMNLRTEGANCNRTCSLFK